MKCLVLGGAGFLGSHLGDHLLAAGHSLRIFDRVEASTRNIAHLLPRCEFVAGDFGNHPLVAEVTRGIDVIFHLISSTVPKSSNDDPVFDLTSNLLPTLHLLECARRNDVRKVIFYSSGGTVYGIPQHLPIPETHPTNPICSYGVHKLAIERYLHLYHHLHGLDYGVLRIGNAFGERQRCDHDQGAIAVFLGRLLHGQPLEVWGDGTIIRDYIYVKDICEAARALAEYGGPERIFNIGSGQGRTLLQVIAGLAEALGKTPCIQFQEPRKLDVPANILDIARAREHLGWSPRTPFAQALEQTIRGQVEPRV